MQEIQITIPQPLQIEVATGNPALEAVLSQLQAQVQSLQQQLQQALNFQPADQDLTEIAQLETTPFGRSLLALASAEQARDVLQVADLSLEMQVAGLQVQIAALQDLYQHLPAYQPADPDLTEIAQLETTPFGRSLLTLASVAALQQLAAPSEPPPAPPISELSYTVTQSSVHDAPGTVCLGTFEKLMDDSGLTGAGTINGGAGVEQWIQVDLGSVKSVISCSFAGGTLGGGFGTVIGALNSSRLEISNDGATWNPIQVIAGAAATSFGNGSSKPTPVHVLVGLPARYLRLWRPSGALATTEFRVRGW